MKPGILRALLHDIAVSLAAGIAGAAALFVLFLLGGLLFKAFDFRGALVVVRGGLLVTGALELFVSAGLLLWPRNGEKLRDSSQWKRFFEIFGLFPVLLVTAVIVLITASFVDYYLYF